MSYFAAAFTRVAGGWQGSEIDLNDVESIEDVADAAAHVESDDGLVVVLLEEEDWFGVVRVETDEEPRLYVSDGAEAWRTTIGESVLSELASDYAVGDDPETDEPTLPSGPLGEAGLLDDLGVSTGYLNRLAANSGSTPSDAMAALAEHLGFVDALESVR